MTSARMERAPVEMERAPVEMERAPEPDPRAACVVSIDNVVLNTSVNTRV